MFINQNFVAILFKLINFIALIGIASFIYKKYMKADIFFLIAKKEADYQDLFNLQRTLDTKQRDLDLLLKQEAIQCQDLRSKIDAWKKIVTLEQEKEAQEHNALLAVAKKRNAEVFLKKENQRVQNTIITAVIIDLEKTLSGDFKDFKKGSHYLDSIVHFMNEKIS